MPDVRSTKTTTTDNMNKIRILPLLLSVAAFNAVSTFADATPDADVTAMTGSVTSTFGSVKTTGLAIASSVLLISLGFWAVKKFYRK